METESRLPELEALLHGKQSNKSPRMTADLIRQITEVPDIYRFSHYLRMPKVQDLLSSDFSQILDILEIFSHGTFKSYQDFYRRTKVELSVKQLFNLRCLSLAILAKDSEGQKISFSQVQSDLGFTDHWEVFDFLIEALNYGYVKGKLDEPAKVLYVDDWATRDVGPQEVEALRNTLDTFLNACDETLKKTKAESDKINAEKAKAVAQKEKTALKIETAKIDLDDQLGSASEEFRLKSESFGKPFRTRGKTSSKSGALSSKGFRG